MTGSLTTAQQALVDLLALHLPTRERALALLSSEAGDVPEGLEGAALWSWWLWEAAPDQRRERLERLRALVPTPAADLSEDDRDDLLELIAAAIVGDQALSDRPPKEATGSHGIVGPLDGPIQQQQSQGPIPELEVRSAHIARKGRLIGFPLLMVGIALGLLGYIVVMLVGGMG